MGDLFASVAKVEHSYSVAPLPTSIKTVKIEMSFFEIYNETLNDLVGPYQDLRVRELAHLMTFNLSIKLLFFLFTVE